MIDSTCASIVSSTGLSGPLRPSNSTGPLLKLRDVIRLYGVSATTVRRAHSKGELRTLTLPSGHRRFTTEDVLKWLGQERVADKIQDGGGTIPIAMVCRVSSVSQSRRVGASDKSSLEHQEARLREYIQERWGEGNVNVTCYKRIASGLLFSNVVLLKLIEDVLAGKYRGGYLIATDEYRVLRFGAKLIEHICKIGGCEVVYTLPVEEKSEADSLTADVLAILTSFTSRVSGAKCRAIYQVKMDEGQLRDAYHWYKWGGLSYAAISERLKSEGRGVDFKGRPISKNVVIKNLKLQWKMLEALYPEAPRNSESNSLKIFVATQIKKGKSARVYRKALIEAYVGWCRRKGLQALSDKRISREITSLGWGKKLDARGSLVYLGVELAS